MFSSTADLTLRTNVYVFYSPSRYFFVFIVFPLLLRVRNINGNCACRVHVEAKVAGLLAPVAESSDPISTLRPLLNEIMTGEYWSDWQRYT